MSREILCAMARSLDNVLSSIPDADHWKLDQDIDFENRDDRGHVIPRHLERIADSMVGWEGDLIADHLGLSEADRRNIRESHPNKPSLQG